MFGNGVVIIILWAVYYCVVALSTLIIIKHMFLLALEEIPIFV